jgi:hypothetical protein
VSEEVKYFDSIGAPICEIKGSRRSGFYWMKGDELIELDPLAGHNICRFASRIDKERAMELALAWDTEK